MAVTRSWTAAGAAPAVLAVGQNRYTGARERAELGWLLCSSLLVAIAMGMVFAAKLPSEAGPRPSMVNLNTVSSADQLVPLLESSPDRDGLAAEVFASLEKGRPLKNVGAIARKLPRRVFAQIKPLMVVRTPREFLKQFIGAAALYFAGFYMVALVWRLARFQGDRSYLAVLHLLSGIGFCLMASLRDPLRDTLEFQKFSIGVFLGCVVLAAAALKPFDYRRLSDWCYTPLLGALLLFGLLLKFGRGPGGSDAKVNLGPFQPVEAIKILLVLFLAGYFTRNWERLRDLREKRVFRDLWRRVGMPRWEHIVPVLCAVGAAIILFFTLKDLGPALVTFFVFLTMFAAARGRPGLAIAGLVLMVASVAIGYRLGTPATVVDRINMWLAPWDNDVHGGNQLAHSLWAFSTGGPYGSGPGWGDPELIPAGNTDLVLPAIGEEWGFAGVAAVFILFAFLIARALETARRSATHYGYFLALGLASLIAFEMLLISSGVLGALPLSGVVSPFLSSGNTAMLANFLVCALLVSISADRKEPAPLVGQTNPKFHTPELLTVGQALSPANPNFDMPELLTTRWPKAVLALAGTALLAVAARYQILKDQEYLARDARSFEQDGVKRPQHNPRLNSIAREIPRGNIYDRNGVPLATSDWNELERHRPDYMALGVDLDHAASKFDSRHYPFGAAVVHVIGDLRTGENFHASNSSLVEHDANARLQGYEYAELAGLVRYRHQPGNPAIARVLARNRNVRLTLDIRLQLRAQEILNKQLSVAHVEKGAVVVMDAATGDVLAMVSAPEPVAPGARAAPPTPDELLDRARYGLYPPGSTFKLVTAMAALRKDPALEHRIYGCQRLPDGRVGITIPGWRRAIKDDIGDRAHGRLDMERAIAVSCNAYFAQLGVYDVGSKPLAEVAAQLGISTGEMSELRQALPFAAYGQGPVVLSPFKMARVAATVAAGGRMPQGRWVAEGGNDRTDAPLAVITPEQAGFLARAMRRVVTEGTARGAMAGSPVNFAGKTGTAQLDTGLPHAWFAGFAPYDGDASRRLAFAVLVEHGGYGARAAAPIARGVMEAAKELGLLP